MTESDTPRVEALMRNPLDSNDLRAWQSLAANLERELAARKGYVLVPPHITLAMLDAWFNTNNAECEPAAPEYFQPRYAAMLLAAAPSATNEGAPDE